MGKPFTILNVSGPYREPREPVFSYDYAVQRPNWPNPNAVRVKVSIQDELDYLRTKLLGVSGGSPGQQMRVNQLLSRRIADQKIHIANDEGMFDERLEALVDPFTGPLAHLFVKLEAWMNETRPAIRQEIKDQVGL